MTYSPPTQFTRTGNRYAPSPARPRRLLGYGVVLLALVAGLGLLIGLNPARPFTFGLDKWWALWIGNGAQDGFPGWVFEHLGGLGAIVVALAVIAPLLILRHWRSAIFVTVAALAAPALTELVFKPLVTRPRPFQELTGLSTPTGVNAFSFPSGHATSVAAIAICLVAIVSRQSRRWMWLVAALLMVGIVWQRTMSNAHWLTDALAGLAVGAGTGLIVWFAFFPAIYQDFERGMQRRAAKAAFLPSV